MAIIHSRDRVQSSMFMEKGIDHSTINWLRQMNSGLGGNQESAFHQRMQHASNYWMTKEALEDTESMMRKYSVSMDLDAFRELHELEHFQAAKPFMRRWVMANPTIKQSWLDGEAEGYDGEFMDTDPGQVGWHDVSWRTVMNGMEVEEEKHYMYETFCDAEEMSFADQCSIRDMWALTDYYMQVDEDDPSSVLGNSL